MTALIGLIIVLSFIPLAVLNGWALSWLWLWFIVPLGAPQIGIAWSIGISALVGMLRGSNPEPPKPEDFEEAKSRLVKAYSRVITMPLASLLIGWLAHLAMS
jgi:hypothetical protein